MNNKYINMTENWQDEALVKEFRKVAIAAGFNVSYFGEVISDRDRKYRNSLKRYHGRNMKYIPLIIKECEKFNISAITVLNPDIFIGDYGKILCGAEKLKYTNHPDDYCIIDSKYIWKTIRNLYNSHNSHKWEVYQFSDGTNHYYYIPKGHYKIKYGSSDWDELIVLSNGQVFDIGNCYYFTIEDSHRLTREIKRGYRYIEPQYFFDDFFGDDE